MHVIVVIAEDHGGRHVVQRLTDRVLCDQGEPGRRNWITESDLDQVRRWRGAREHELFTPLSKLNELVEEHHKVAKRHRVPRLHGKFQGEPGVADAALFRKALRVATVLCPGCDAVVIARDRDRARFVRAFEQACAEGDWPFKVLLAAPEPEIEAWFVAGFVPKDEQERARLAEVRRKLGFDPTMQPHELRSTAKSPKDAKEILRELTGADQQRKMECLEADLETLLARGEECGLAAFMRQLRELLVPLIRG